MEARVAVLEAVDRSIGQHDSVPDRVRGPIPDSRSAASFDRVGLIRIETFDHFLADAYKKCTDEFLRPIV